MTGLIFNIQRFSLHDGPGIRTIIFLKGCGLRCAWCCNPESQSRDIETLHGKTVGSEITAVEALDVILRDLPYYRRSSGGVTLSGGEALLQPEFAQALFTLCKEEGLHTAIETAAYVPWENIAAVLPVTDLFLLDIKHMQAAKHERFTGQSNTRILENAQKLEALAKMVIIRVPTIPGVNDTPDEIAAIAEFAVRIKVHAIHLLPYHRLGQDKYAGLGRPYPMGDVAPPSTAYMQTLKAVVEQFGLSCQIGG